MPVITQHLRLSTQGHGDILRITDQVAGLVASSGLAAGIVTLFTPSATSALTTIDFEPGALSDFRRLFDELAHPDAFYEHNARMGDGNGHSHVRSALLGPSLTVPFVDGKLTLGAWQQIIFVDFESRPRQRSLVAQIMGEM